MEQTSNPKIIADFQGFQTQLFVHGGNHVIHGFIEQLHPFSDQSGFTSPPPDPSKFEPTSILGFPAALIAEQLTKIETVSSPVHMFLMVAWNYTLVNAADDIMQLSGHS